MTMNRTDSCYEPSIGRAESRRRRVVTAARILSAGNGFHATSVAQIAKASGVAVGQIYRDFGGKDDIVAAVVSLDCAQLLDRGSLLPAIARSDAAAIWEWMRRFVRPPGDREASLLLVEILAEATRNERIGVICAQMRDETFAMMLSAIAALAPGGRGTLARELLAELVLTQSLGIKLQMLLQPDLAIDRLVDAVMTAVGREVKRINAFANA